MDFDIGVVAVGLAREQGLDLTSFGLRLQRLEQVDALFLGLRVALGLAELDQRHGVVEFALELRHQAELFLKLGALAHDLLRGLGVVPEIGVFDPRVQFREAACGCLDVKDASSAVPRTA